MAVAACILLAAIAASCGRGDPPPADPVHRARVLLPDYPFVENESIRVDRAMLDILAGEFLAAGGRAHEVPAFLFSFVPVRSFDRIAGGAFDRLEYLEGLLYLSGYFGGVWLKQVLNPGASSRIGARAGPEDSGLPGKRVFSLLASVTGTLNDKVRRGDPEAIRDMLFDSLDPFLFLYGYNLGYLESILERPPAGVDAPAGYLACFHFMDCRTPVQGISALEDLLLLVAQLTEPPDDRWILMKTKVDALGPPAREAGYGVWSGPLNTEGMLPDDYFTLLDLSAGFLLYCQVLVLSAMDAWVNEGEAAGRVSLAVGAGMAAWVGGYGIGLAFGDPGGELPRIVPHP
jgi:hypothetical protein